MAPAGTDPSNAPDAPNDARDREGPKPRYDARPRRNAECSGGGEDDSSDLRTATRLLRLAKLASGALVSALTALKLLGVL